MMIRVVEAVVDLMRTGRKRIPVWKRELVPVTIRTMERKVAVVIEQPDRFPFAVGSPEDMTVIPQM
jgi:hypothetical protein